MSHRDVIVVGASRGGVEALTRLISGLAPELEAAVLVVMHVAPQGPSFLADRLGRSSSLPMKEAQDGEALAHGRIYVCVPDRHLMIEGDRVRVSRGPKESHARPSVDVLFRSAAYAVGPRAIGIVLTGQLDDGTAGLWAIKDRGGISIVQDPQEAPFPSMPSSAVSHVAIDCRLRVEEMPGTLLKLTRENLELPRESHTPDKKLGLETGIALRSTGFKRGVRELGTPSFYTCPECHGTMVMIEEGTLRRYRCHTGHGFTQGALSQDGLTQIETTLWSALAQIEEQSMLQVEFAEQAAGAGRPELEVLHRNRVAQIDAFAERTPESGARPVARGTAGLMAPYWAGSRRRSSCCA